MELPDPEELAPLLDEPAVPDPVVLDPPLAVSAVPVPPEFGVETGGVMLGLPASAGLPWLLLLSVPLVSALSPEPAVVVVVDTTVWQ